MRIIFLCGSLEPGRDGVGDYTRRLATELKRQGHETALISLKDKEVTTSSKSTQHSDSTDICVLRIPAKLPAHVVYSEARENIVEFKPEWISLQYVSFSFHNKGLPVKLSRLINQITRGYLLHVMIHELWVGMNQEAPLKLRCWGYLQKRIIISFLKKVSPVVVTTQTRLYQKQLNKFSINVKILPLFSNIHFIKNIIQIKEPTRVDFIVFGSIHPGAPIKDFAKEAAEYGHNNNLKITIYFIGRCGKEQEYWADILQFYGVEAKILGEQPEEKISFELSKASIGISNTPYYLMDKSGAVAAMKEHRLPVICLSHKWTSEMGDDLENRKLFDYEKGNLSQLINKKTLVDQTNLAFVALSFANELLSYKKNTFN